jgi:tetratricopeptide (TPR) repeat protein
LNTACLYYNLGLFYSKVNEYEEAIKCFNKALDIKLKLSKDYEDVANTYNLLGELCIRMNKGKEDKNCFDNAIEV